MVSLSTRITDLTTAIGTQLKTIKTSIGTLASLTTTEKSSLVGAVNEIKAAVGAGSPTTLDDLTDVTLTNITTGDILRFNGSALVNVDGATVFQLADADLATIAAQANQSYGLGLLALANQAALQAKVGLAPVALSGSASDITTGTLPTSVLPSLAVNDTFPAASQAEMLALTAQRGDIAVRTDIGRMFILTAEGPGNLANWTQLTAAGDVISVAGRTGTVVLTKADVGLGNVDNVQQQPLDADLTAIATLVGAADRVLTTTGPGSWALVTQTAFARTLLDDPDAATARGTLSVYSKAEVGNPDTDFVAVLNTALA